MTVALTKVVQQKSTLIGSLDFCISSQPIKSCAFTLDVAVFEVNSSAYFESGSDMEYEA